MPGWQQFYTENHDQNFELLSVAMEVQGVQKALPWLEKAQATYVALVDNENKLGGQFNFNYIPLTILFDEKGRMDRGPQYFRESDPEVYQEIANWLRDGKSALTQQAPKLPFKAGGFESPEAELRFHLGALLIQNHQKE
ncbi:MAG: TlpA disulfide reductase family protein, partial [bacterium]